MDNYAYLSKDVIDMVNQVYQALLLAKERLADLLYSSEDQWGEDKLRRTLDGIDKLCKKYPWLHEVEGI